MVVVVVVITVVVVVVEPAVVTPNGGCVIIFTDVVVEAVLVVVLVVTIGCVVVTLCFVVVVVVVVNIFEQLFVIVTKLTSNTTLGYIARSIATIGKLHATGLSWSETSRSTFTLVSSNASTSTYTIWLRFRLSVCKPTKLTKLLSVIFTSAL